LTTAVLATVSLAVEAITEEVIVANDLLTKEASVHGAGRWPFYNRGI